VNPIIAFIGVRFRDSYLTKIVVLLFTAFSAITAVFIFSSSAIPVASSAKTLASITVVSLLVCYISGDNNDSQDIPLIIFINGSVEQSSSIFATAAPDILCAIEAQQTTK
jgi:hypothetical protein